MSDSVPVLWQLPVSHYSEKVRWALAYKGIEHERRSPIPGTHIPLALWLTRGSQITLPIMQLNGQQIGDSTAIVAALEERYPEPPLYPADPDERRRALELEDFFDEELGPYTRLLAFHELGKDRERFAAVVRRTTPGPLARGPGAAAYARAFTVLRFGAGSSKSAEAARTKILAALERLEAELGDSDYLAGDSFTVADIAAASLFYPLVLPEGSPVPTDEPPPEGLKRFRAPLKERRGFKWVEEMFRRHRKPAKAAAS
jgi:glutathione S-transferase